MDSYCTKCSLQFGNMTVYDMHMSIVHKENVESKQEPSSDILEKDIVKPEKLSFQCEYCDKVFFEKRHLKKHAFSIYSDGNSKLFNII